MSQSILFEITHICCSFYSKIYIHKTTYYKDSAVLSKIHYNFPPLLDRWTDISRT